MIIPIFNRDQCLCLSWESFCAYENVWEEPKLLLVNRGVCFFAATAHCHEDSSLSQPWLTNQVTSVNIPSTIQAREYVAAELNVVRQQRCCDGQSQSKNWQEAMWISRFINYFSILVKIPASDEFCTMNAYIEMWRYFKKIDSVVGNFPKWLLTPSVLFSDAPSTGISRKHVISI